ncbi:MAG: hypothetical protein M3N08_03770 [Pseudomonadota bacterium]|nr:hypothetical protein [Pseudomonadota bacterium]
MPQAIIGFVAQNANNVLHAFSGGHNFQFEKAGYATTIINLLAPDCYEQLGAFARQHDILFGYGYAGIGAHLRADDGLFWDKLKIPFLSLLYDHPFYHPALHKAPSQYVYNCYGIQDFLDVQRSYIKSTQPSLLLKVSSDGYANPHDVHWQEIPWPRRDILGIFLKTGDNPAIIEASFDVMPGLYRTITLDCIGQAKTNSNLNLADHVKERFARAGLDCADPKIWEDFIYIVRVIDRYMRSWRSYQLVEHIKHLPVLIIGNGWDYIEKESAAAQFLPSMSMEDVKHLLYRTRFVFNAHPYARHGWHERVFYGLEYGAAIISDRTLFSDAHFADLPNFVGFDWGDTFWPAKVKSAMARLGQQGFDLRPGAMRLVEHFPAHAISAQMLEIAHKARQ